MRWSPGARYFMPTVVEPGSRLLEDCTLVEIIVLGVQSILVVESSFLKIGNC